MITSPLYRSDTTEKLIPIVAHVAPKESFITKIEQNMNQIIIGDIDFVTGPYHLFFVGGCFGLY